MFNSLVSARNQYINDLRADTFRMILRLNLGLVCLLSLYTIFFEFNLFTVTRSGEVSKTAVFVADVLGHIPLWTVTALVALCHQLQQRSLPLARPLYIAALLAGPTLDILIYGPDTQGAMVYIVVLIVISIITGFNQIVIALLICALMSGGALAWHALNDLPLSLAALEHIWPSARIAVLVGIAGYIYEHNVSDAAAWALESQQKDEKRRLLLQKKQDELDKTVMELKFAHSQLELLNSALAEAKNKAEQANSLKSRFLANMSHELRTPLNAIINFTHILGADEFGGLREDQRLFQSRITFNAEHLLSLINDILDLAKIESGHMELHFEPVQLAPLLKSIMSTVIGLTRDKGLELKLEVAEQLPPVLIDKTRIRQVLLNLLSNAAKFTHKGTITLRAALVDEAFVQVSVQDTGIGIPADHEALIFEEFRQVQGEMTRQYQGTGLGLPISKHLVEIHGGRMWLTSAVGCGSTFSFTVPAAPPAAG